MARHNETGKIGEQIAAKWLISKSHKIIEQNYLKKWGEIDIVSELAGTLHFVEVKTVSYETKDELEYAVLHETWRPEDKVHNEKLKRLARTIQSWLLEKKLSNKFQIDVVVVRLVPREKYATTYYIPNIIVE